MLPLNKFCKNQPIHKILVQMKGNMLDKVVPFSPIIFSIDFRWYIVKPYSIVLSTRDSIGGHQPLYCILYFIMPLTIHRYDYNIITLCVARAFTSRPLKQKIIFRSKWNKLFIREYFEKHLGVLSTVLSHLFS